MPTRIVTARAPKRASPRKKAKPAAAPVPATITAAQRPRGRKIWVDDGKKTSPEVEAFFARNVRPGGPLPPGVEE